MILAIVIALTPPAFEAGRATTYYPPGVLATGERYRASARHVAHRTIPLGTPGIICSLRTGRCARTVVRDRGPWGTLRPCDLGLDTRGVWDLQGPRWKRPRRIRWLGRCHWWQAQVPRRRGWRYRGVFDLTPRVARALGHRTFDHLIFWRTR